MMPFIVKPAEAIQLHDNDTFVFSRKVGSQGVYLPPTLTLDPAYKQALLTTSKYQIGRLFWVQEQFKHVYYPESNETTIQYVADARYFRVNPISGRLIYGKNGIYNEPQLEEPYTRCRLEVKALDIELRNVVSAGGRVMPLKQWCWLISFLKREIGENGVY